MKATVTQPAEVVLDKKTLEGTVPNKQGRAKDDKQTKHSQVAGTSGLG